MSFLFYISHTLQNTFIHNHSLLIPTWGVSLQPFTLMPNVGLELLTIHTVKTHTLTYHSFYKSSVKV